MHILFLRTAWCFSALFALMPLATKAMAGGSDDESEQPSGARAAATGHGATSGACAAAALVTETSPADHPPRGASASKAIDPRTDVLQGWIQKLHTHLQTTDAAHYPHQRLIRHLDEQCHFEEQNVHSPSFIQSWREEPFLDRLAERIRTSGWQEIPFDESSQTFDAEGLILTFWQALLEEATLSVILASVPKGVPYDDALLSRLIPTQQQLKTLIGRIAIYYYGTCDAFLRLPWHYELTDDWEEGYSWLDGYVQAIHGGEEIRTRLRARRDEEDAF